MQKQAMYEMHKYWGKKPGGLIGEYINKYSKVNDVVLDPFSGYGVIACEALLNRRNVIANDLNPISNFLNYNLLNKEISFDELDLIWNQIKSEFKSYNDEWYSCFRDGKRFEVISTLRSKDDIPYKIKYKGEKNNIEKLLSVDEINAILEKEKHAIIEDWYPKELLIENSRISAKKGMTVECLFTKRELSCLSRLLALIEKYSKGSTVNSLLKMAFTANLANCSKLVPPIKSRGEMSQGAWMTGFYIGETYIENNVLHYYENRLKKVINGKKQYISMMQENNCIYRITHNDCCDLSDLKDGSIDYVLTDPPYGDVVPYFEQSIIWNSWLKKHVDYDKEIVISDAKNRNKQLKQYSNDIDRAYSEIYRILKNGSYFTFTFHSVYGTTWKAIINACLKNGFEFIDLRWMVQATFSPRQLNRRYTIKGDLIITLKKNQYTMKLRKISACELELEILELLKKNIGIYDTNELYLQIISYIFKNRYYISNLNIIDLLNTNFEMRDGKWIIK